MSLFSALTVSATGMEAQRTRAALLVENIANSETTRTPEGGPYRRKDAIFTTQDVGSAFGDEMDAQLAGSTLSGVSVAGITVDGRQGTGKMVWTQIDDDNFVHEALDRSVDGQPLPDRKTKYQRVKQ